MYPESGLYRLRKLLRSTSRVAELDEVIPSKRMLDVEGPLRNVRRPITRVKRKWIERRSHSGGWKQVGQRYGRCGGTERLRRVEWRTDYLEL